MSKKSLALVGVLVLFCFSLSGCYYFSARNEIREAEKSLAQLKGAGGEKQVPYEYCSAEKNLENANLEFSHNHFGVAKGFATKSKSAAQAGLAQIKKK